MEGEALKDRRKLAGKKQLAGSWRKGARENWELSVWVEDRGGSRANLACRQQERLLPAALKMRASQEIHNHLIEGMTVGRGGWHLPIRLNRAKEGVFIFKNSTQIHSKLEGDAQEEKCLQWLIWIISNVPPGHFCIVQNSESFTCFSIQSFPFHFLVIYGLIMQVLFR